MFTPGSGVARLVPNPFHPKPVHLDAIEIRSLAGRAPEANALLAGGKNMLLVTFHGGTGKGINNVYGYATHPGGRSQKAVLICPADVELAELRGLAVWGGNLYVVNGAKKASNVLVFRGPPTRDLQFVYSNTVIGRGQSIDHPFGLAFESPELPANCYVSNQDSNVVAQVGLTAGGNGTVIGRLGSGCQSAFLTKKYPHPPHDFLDGTFVASHHGDLEGVAVVAPNVPKSDGGLGVKGTGAPRVPSNSVRDVAIANGILFVCDEVDCTINMYDLHDGTFVSRTAVGHAPTHLAIHGGALWVSADERLYWSLLPGSPSAASLSLQPVTLDHRSSSDKVGGVSFDDRGNVYVVFQDGTGRTGTGSIGKYVVTAGSTGSPPSLSDHETFAKGFSDTPEFCLWVSDDNWPG